MRNDRILGRIFIIAIFLSSCAVPLGTISISPEPPDASATRTPFLPTNDTPAPASDTPPSAATETDTLAPTGTPIPSRQVNLEAVGDIMLARTVGEQVQAHGPQIVFAGVQSVFDSADVLVGNLECALTAGGEPQPKSYPFAAPPEMAQALALAGFDVLSLANNHAMDYGNQGLFDTRDNLGQYGIASVGAGANAAEAHAPVILERNGLRLAFLAYVDVPVEKDGFDARTWIATASQPGIAWADLDQITSDVAAARLQADIVIVQLHSGYEVGSYIPTISPNQRAEAHAAIDAGAALVLGSHPHILQSIEPYHGGLIAYSLGNFVMDDYQGTANATIILRVVLTRAGVQSYDWVPVLIKNGLPRLATEREAPVIGTLVAPMNP
jgi:poly-gamma-glutamate capsule biosynthesis protein CapA/YwtB (metallophosphatase superfamily)